MFFLNYTLSLQCERYQEEDKLLFFIEITVFMSVTLLLSLKRKKNPGCFGKRWSQDDIINKQYLSRYLELYNAHLPLVNTIF